MSDTSSSSDYSDSSSSSSEDEFDQLVDRFSYEKTSRKDDSREESDYEEKSNDVRRSARISNKRLRPILPRRSKLKKKYRTTYDGPKRHKKRRKKVVPLPFKPKTWGDVLMLARMSNELDRDTFYQDCHVFKSILPVMEDIDKLVGLEKIKQVLADHIISESSKAVRKSNMCHIVITGPSGCGKTTLARCIARLFNKMGLLQTDQVVVGNRTNLIGAYVGQTSKMTQLMINRAMGGCLLIDEAYQLGASSQGGSIDSFSRNCLDTLNQNLSEHGDKFQCIVVGYKENMEREFFAHNPGLKRRFQWRFEVPPCGAKHLQQIFMKMIRDQKLMIDESTCTEQWMSSRMNYFPHYGGSMENLVSKVKLAHCRRVFGENRNAKGVITEEDVENGFIMYRTFDMSHHNPNKPPMGMYT